MWPSLCWSCLASILKLLNFLQTFVGVSIILYSAWILNHLIGNNIDFGFSFDFDKLPAPWFVCALMVFGILVCLIAFTGHVAAEAISSCYLCFYAILTMMLIFLEAVLVGDLVLNKRWEEVVSLLLAMILQTMIPRRKLDCYSDEDFIVIRRPLLNPQSDPTYASTTVHGKGHHIWSSRMRQKYGLNQN